MYIGFNQNIKVYDTPAGFVWYYKYSNPMKTAGNILYEGLQKKIIDVAGYGIKTDDLLFKFKNNYDIKEIKNTIKSLQGKVLKFYKKKPKISILGSRKVFYPLHACIEVTTACNLKCKHCYKDAGNMKVQHINTINLIKHSKTMIENGLTVVELTGGECLLHPHIWEIIEHFVTNNKIEILAIVTNGYFLTENILKRLKVYIKKIFFNISLDASTHKTHDSFRGVNGSWVKALNALKLTKKYGFLTRAAMSVYPENFFDIEKTLLLAIKSGAKVFAWSPILPSGRGVIYQKDYEALGKNYGMKLYEYETYIMKKYKKYIDVVNPRYLQRMVEGKENCGIGYRSWVIEPSGNVRPCLLMPENLINIGNIFQESIEKIVHKPVINALFKVRGGNSTKECSSCMFSSYCHLCFYRTLQKAINYPDCTWINKESVKEVLKYVDLSSLTQDNICHKGTFE